MAADVSPVHLTVAQAAEHAGVSVKTIRRWIRRGRLPTGRAGLVHVIDQADLERAMADVGQSTDSPSVPRPGHTGQALSVSLVHELVATIERQAGEIATLRLELAQAQARILALGAPREPDPSPDALQRDSDGGAAEPPQQSAEGKRPWWRFW